MLKSRQRWITLVVLVVELATGATLVRSRTPNGHQFDEGSRQAAETQLRQRLIGKWADNYQAKRTLMIRPDGTATMICQLQGMHRFFATQLLFEQVWQLDGDRLTLKTVRGEPQKKVDFVVRLKGDTFRQTVLEVTDSVLRVYDDVEATEFHWQRVPDESSGSSQLLAQSELDDE